MASLDQTCGTLQAQPHHMDMQTIKSWRVVKIYSKAVDCQFEMLLE